jgi:carboxyl-terminal processing protease
MVSVPSRPLPLVCLGVLSSLARTAWAGDPIVARPPDAEVMRWIARLGSASFRERDEATAPLERLGEAAEGALRQVEKTSTDAEVLRRGRFLLDIRNARVATATVFADKVLVVMAALEEHSAASPGWDLLTGAALRGLLQAEDTELLADLARRLTAKPPRNGDEARAFLRDGYLDLMHRRGLAWKECAARSVRNMLAEVDPYGDLDERSGFRCILPGDGVGVGLRLAASPETGLIRIVTAVKGSPARRAGIQPDDVLTGIAVYTDPDDGTPLAIPRVLGMDGKSVNQAYRVLLGKEGTRVDLIISRRGLSKLLTVETERGPVREETVMGWKRRRDDSWDYWIDPDKKFAYARIPRFCRGVGEDLEGALKDLCEKGMKGLILDLRGTPGGLLSTAVDVAGLFVGGKTAFTIPGRGRPLVYHGSDKRILPPFALACLTDEDTASSAELVAACLQDHRRAVIAGQRSHGKGTIQNIMPFEDGKEMTFTTAAFYRPGGGKIDRMRLPGRPADEWGVTPDPGLALNLTPREREELKAHLERAEIVVGDPDVWDKIRSGFRDRQRDLALRHLRGLVKG